MKTNKKGIIFFGAVIFLVFAASSASAITDGTGDIYHWSASESSWSWGAYSGEKPNIDITEVDYSVSGSDITATIKVDGEIQSSETIFYYVYLVSDTGEYFAYYYNGIAMWSGTDGYLGEGGIISQYSATGDTLTLTFSPTNPSETFTIYGYAQELSSAADMATSEWWADYAPATYAPWYTAEEDTSGDGTQDTTTGDDLGSGDSGSSSTTNTPGFEIITLLAAIAVALIFLRKRK